MSNPLVAEQTAMAFDVEKIRADFPILQQQVHGKALVYLDNAATAQKPASVIDSIADYYRDYNSNVHRGVHTLSQQATDAYEQTRSKIQAYINAGSEKEIIFVRGATEGINLVAQTFGRDQLKAGDDILITEMEHHSNIVPWQMLAEQTGANLRYVPITDEGELDMDAFERLLTDQTKLVAVVHISNALGTINPVETIIKKAHAVGARVLLDGAQAIPHQRIDVQALDCDFYVFSGHKLFGPTGIGVLYGKHDLLESMPPYQGGGDMIKMVTMEKTLYNDLPYKFEAGTPNIADSIGLGAAIDYLQTLDDAQLQDYEQQLLHYGTELLDSIDGLQLIGTAKNKTGILSFTLAGIHPHDIGTILDHEGIAIRAGHHCAMPVMERYQLPATARASLAFYNTRDEIDKLAAAIRKCQEIFH